MVRDTIITALPGAVVVDPANAYLLGSPIGDLGSISTSLDENTKALSIMGEHFVHFSAHDSLVLLQHSFAIPKLHYLLRTTPCFLSGHLEEYDSVLRSILSSVTNCPLVQDEKAWLQASLPVKLGCLGIRRAVQVAPSAYLSSTAATSNLVTAILPNSYHSIPVPSADIALAKWSQDHNGPPCQGQGTHREKNWDGISCTATASSLLDSATDEVTWARLLAVMSRDTGAWLQALPNSSLGLRSDDNTLRISVGLHLGTAIGVPHLCHCCGKEVTAFGIHGLSCKSSSGRHHRYAAINEIMHRSLSTGHLMQQLSVAVQCRNAAVILACIPPN